MGISFNIGFFVIALFLVLIGYYAYRRTTPPITGRLRVVLTGLRMMAFVLIAFLLMDPRYILRTETDVPAEVVALIDRSASMPLPAHGSSAASSITRFDRDITV